jgi:hypothetical protein
MTIGSPLLLMHPDFLGGLAAFFLPKHFLAPGYRDAREPHEKRCLLFSS